MIIFFCIPLTDKDDAQGSVDSGRLSPAGAQVDEEEDKIADLGKPKLGDTAKCTVKIKESYEFKVWFFGKYFLR